MKSSQGFPPSGEREGGFYRGFTGHEYLPWFNLVNMNGRMYDPLVGRFLSPDPYVQDAASTLDYNRYAYCLNNPLKYTDPSGFKYFQFVDPEFGAEGQLRWYAPDISSYFQNTRNRAFSLYQNQVGSWSYNPMTGTYTNKSNGTSMGAEEYSRGVLKPRSLGYVRAGNRW